MEGARRWNVSKTIVMFVKHCPHNIRLNVTVLFNTANKERKSEGLYTVATAVNIFVIHTL
jgi:hypothetical protein